VSGDPAPSGAERRPFTAIAQAPVLPTAPDVVVLEGDCLDILATLPDAAIDAVVCDPPYGLEFGGCEWDAPWKYGFSAFGHDDGGGSRRPAPTFGSPRNPVCRRCRRHKRGADRCTCERPDFDEAEHRLRDMLAFAAWCEAWAAGCLRVLKPGGHLLAFGGARTHHWLAAGIEAAGFEIRDCIAWMKFGGFPKSTDLGKQFDRRAGARRRVLGLRRVHDLRGGRWADVVGLRGRHGTYAVTAPATDEARRWTGWAAGLKPVWEPVIVARRPPDGPLVDNVARHGTGALNADGCRIPWSAGEQGAYFGGRNITARKGERVYAGGFNPDYRTARHPLGRFPGNAVTAEPDAFWSPYTLVAPPEVCRRLGYGGERDLFNDHPTVKPVPIMRWLCRLVTPPGGRVLDPFAGSGSTGVACVAEGFAAVLVERDPHYAAIARRRVAQDLGQPDHASPPSGRAVPLSLFAMPTGAPP
jgi:DNA modification methylase